MLPVCHRLLSLPCRLLLSVVAAGYRMLWQMRVCAYCADIVGMRRQARGLADAVATLASAAIAAPVEVVDIAAPGGGFGKVLPRVASYFVAPLVPLPDIVVACGGASAAGALRARREGAFVVYVQKPPLSVRAFDIVVCGAHDGGGIDNNDNNGEGKGEGNVMTIAGSVGGVNALMLAARRGNALAKFSSMPRPLVALIIGGDNRAFSLTPDLCRQFIDEVRSANNGGTIVALSSRRTSAECRRILAAAADDNNGGNNYHNNNGDNNDDGDKDNKGDNNNKSGGGRFYYYADDGDEEKARDDYYDILAAADIAVVSGDSVNMISEAATAGMPVYMLPLVVKSRAAAAKFAAFHSRMTKDGAALEWRGRFDNFDNAGRRAAGFDETARAAAEVWRRYVCDRMPKL